MPEEIIKSERGSGVPAVPSGAPPHRSGAPAPVQPREKAAADVAHRNHRARFRAWVFRIALLAILAAYRK